MRTKICFPSNFLSNGPSKEKDGVGGIQTAELLSPNFFMYVRRWALGGLLNLCVLFLSLSDLYLKRHVLIHRLIDMTLHAMIIFYLSEPDEPNLEVSAHQA